ncbi:hypothetical protein FRC10_009724 [Ceratobasidium sp. 414]|nr:hypothetical protein FRC10_009724 [Ceratobasidium sp. 414]
MVFANEIAKDFVGQYYGSGQEMVDITGGDPSNYRKVVMAVLNMLSTDFLAILGGQHLLEPPLSMSLILAADRNMTTTVSVASAVTYVNGTRGLLPDEANIYMDSMTNLVNAVMDAVNLDLGSQRYQNLYMNATTFQQAIVPNPPPAGIPSSNWAARPDSHSFYYGRIKPPYQTWAEMLLAGQPVTVGALTGLPDQSAMATTYLCPTYRAKPTGRLLASVFVGSATMITAVWGVWMLLTTFLAKCIMEPRESVCVFRRVLPNQSRTFAGVQCLCDLCKGIQAREEEARGGGEAETMDPVGAGVFAGLERSACSCGDEK